MIGGAPKPPALNTALSAARPVSNAAKRCGRRRRCKMLSAPWAPWPEQHPTPPQQPWRRRPAGTNNNAPRERTYVGAAIACLSRALPQQHVQGRSRTRTRSDALQAQNVRRSSCATGGTGREVFNLQRAHTIHVHCVLDLIRNSTRYCSLVVAS